MMKKILTKNEPLGLHFILRQRVFSSNKNARLKIQASPAES